MLDLDWSALFIPTGSLAEIFVRGSAIYLVLFLVMRFLPRRTIGALGPSDLLVIVLIADAVENAMAGGYESLTEGLLLAGVIFGWATFIDYLDFRFPHLNIAAARAKEMVRNGKLLHENMAREQVTEEEVMAQLRQHGLASARDVVAAYVEGDGHFSVVVRGRAPLKPPTDRKI
jgi:uncharacterized membrane protein YcaP (DUF421 family)